MSAHGRTSSAGVLGSSDIPDIPPLPDDATPEQKDLYWFTHVYQGDRVPQLTVRAVAMGAVLGMLMSVSNLYTVLKVGWSFGVAITSCVLSYAIWNALRALTGGRLSRMSILENNCMQSTASSAGAATGLCIATCFGALMLLDPEHKHQPWLVVASFTLTTAAMGVFLAIPLKRQMINQEQLPFPSGIAAATTLKSLYSEGVEAMHKAYALVVGLAIGAVVGVLTTAEGMLGFLDRFFHWMRDHLFSVQIPELMPAGGFTTVQGRQLVAGGFEPSVLLIGAGMIVGLRVSLSMLAASALLYFVFTPWLAGIDAANAATAGWAVSIPFKGDFYFPTRWGLWGGTAVMVFASLTSLAFQWKTIARSFRMFRGAPKATGGRSAMAAASDGAPVRSGQDVDPADIDARMAAIEVPTSWLIAGMIPISIAMVVIQIVAFSITWWAGIIAVAMSFVLSLVACRATGETDTNPIGAMGKVMQLTFALIMPNQVTPNLVSAGIAANSAAASGDLLTDLKSGYLLGANPRKQFLAQFIGVFFGTAAIVPAWYLLIPNVETLETNPLPATRTWEAVARVLSQGLDALPMSARISILVGAIIGVVLPILERLFPKARPWMPSAMGLGLGWVVFFSNALAFSIGAIIAWVWGRVARRSHDIFNIPLASGLVAGESLLRALLAMTATAIGLASSK